MTQSKAGPVALVTGGGGFLGQAVVEHLVADGCRVRSLSRGDYPALAALGVEHIRAPLTDAAAVRSACAGVDVVYHVAAKAGLGGRYADYVDANVRGTEVILDACRHAGIGRLVYTSSPSVVFDGSDMEGADESASYPAHYHSHYSATKALGEQAVLAANDSSLRTLALRPHLIWGPRDNHILPRIVARARSGRLRIVGDGQNRVDTVYVDNAAEVHLCAARALDAEPQSSGRAYFISNDEPVNAWDFINRLLAVAGVAPVRKRISRRAARSVGAVCEWLWTVLPLSGEPPMTRFLADELSTSHWFDISAARQLLGYSPRVSLDEGLGRLQAWLRDEESRQ